MSPASKDAGLVGWLLWFEGVRFGRSDGKIGVFWVCESVGYSEKTLQNTKGAGCVFCYFSNGGIKTSMT